MVQKTYTGYYAERYDEAASDVTNRFDAKAKDSVEQCVLNDSSIISLGAPVVTGHSFVTKNEDIKYAMLPVYILNLDFAGKKYTYAVNGQNGKISGKVPVSKTKVFSTIAIGSCIFYVIGYILRVIALLGGGVAF